MEAARQLGFEFVSRSQTGLVLSMLGEEVEYEVLNILEYSSDRGCMSVIARAPDGTIRLFCKGSDAKVMRKVRPGTDPALLRQTDENLHTFARQVGFWRGARFPSAGARGVVECGGGDGQCVGGGFLDA